MFQKIVLCLAFIGTVSCTGQSAEEPQSIIVYKTNEPILVDGLANETSWNKAEISNDFIDIEGGKQPTYKTNVRMLWDETYLYFFAELEEPHVWATLKQRDTVIFYNNDFEIFIDPDGDTHNYYEFEMNALNTVWDLFIAKPYRESAPIVDSWEILGLKSAVHVNGTLNDSSDTDNGWSVEVAMPWEVLKEASGSNAIPEGGFWRINFSRVNWDFDLVDGKYARKKDANGNFLPEHNWVWSPQGVINMHEPEHWGYAYFSPNVAGNEDSFQIPQDEQIRWMLYHYYREQKKYRSENGSWATSLEELGLEPILVGGSQVQLDLELHRMGWSIQAKSPFTGHRYAITQDGKYQQIK
ncbi:carbohydrate-binding family 9-like protein [Allomuricauda sp. CAU 1633]|uniref:carbohydrate-binding family 9-like protein n=1 Tax=Allomuricauda sp. CAU 1633 TaxID=2816036 RepID=UPI00293D2AB0|nr:carbohydrate-binding family 9-like protein [Muricauda sp. CAU 1633]